MSVLYKNKYVKVTFNYRTYIYKRTNLTITLIFNLRPFNFLTMNVLHKIKAYLYENFLTENPNDYTARVSSERTLNVKDICSVAVTRGGAATTAAAMEHNAILFFKEMAYQMCDGYAVNTGYFTASSLIKGVFDSKTEKFDPKKHSVIFQFNQGELLRSEIPTIGFGNVVKTPLTCRTNTF